MPLKRVSLWFWSVVNLKSLWRLFRFLASSLVVLLRMPAQYTGDPVNSALQRMLSQKRVKDSSVLNYKLIPNAKQILEDEVKYETVCTSTNQLLDTFKSQYKILSTLGATLSSLTSSSSSTSGSSSPAPSLKNNRLPSPPKQQNANRTQTEKSPPSNEPTVPVPKKILFLPESVVTGWKNSSVPVGSGFVNLGDTCYLNSTLQALFHVPPFVNWLLDDTAHFEECRLLNGTTHSECLICAMSRTLRSSQEQTGSAMKPSVIYSKLKLICKHLNHGHQEDAHEFLRYLLEGMERSYLSKFNGTRLDNLTKETTPLGQIFGGYIRQEVTCLECKHISTTFQHFQDLILDIRTSSSVEEALENYFARECLGDHAYKCEQCKRRVAATKKFSLERPPKALCVQLKRFGVLGGKNSKHINIKQWLDMTKFRHRPSVGSQLRYKLVSLVNHHGQSSSCGHYTAIGQGANGCYYLFDDSMVRTLSLNHVLNTNPYILMYELDTSSKPVASNGVNGWFHRTLSADQLKTPSKCSYGRLSPLKFKGASPQLSASAPNLNGPSTSSAQMAAAQSSSSSSSAASPTEPLIGPVGPPAQTQSTPSSSTNSTSVTSSSPAASSSSNKPRSSETPNKSTQNSSRNGEGPRLVPYVSEGSSDSESEATSPASKTSAASATSPTTTNGWSKDESKRDKTDTRSSGDSPQRDKRKSESNGRSAQLGPLKVDVEKNSNGWSTAPARTDDPSPGSSNAGKWHEAVNSSRDDTRTSDRPRMSSSEQNNTVQSLLRMSHQGYGHTGINTWHGSRSLVDQEVEKDREANKRPRSPYDNHYDKGKVKKTKYHHMNGNMNKDRNRIRFQDFQNRKNAWGPNHRRDYYHNYVFKPNYNNNRFQYNKWQ